MPTTRQQMVLLLSEGQYGARDLSQMLSIPEKEVYTHLSHIARSVVPKGQRLVVVDSRCVLCGYVFGKRKRFNKPSRCPHCRSERIQGPTYGVVKLSDQRSELPGKEV